MYFIFQIYKIIFIILLLSLEKIFALCILKIPYVPHNMIMTLLLYMLGLSSERKLIANIVIIRDL